MANSRKDTRSLLKRSGLLGWRIWGNLTGFRRALPNYIIIGAHKAGTTSLDRYLKQHPNVIAGFKKEVKYFDCNFGRGLNWYRSHFPYRAKIKSTGFITGEGSPYYIFHPLAPQRLAKTLPNIKMIALLRNPINRAYSHHQGNFATTTDSEPFEVALKKEPDRLRGQVRKILMDDKYPLFSHMKYSYLAKGVYVDQLQEWYRWFPKEKILIVKSEDMFNDTKKTFQQITDFLDLPRWQLNDTTNSNPRAYPPMRSDTREWLADYFRPHNKRLYELLGRDFGWN